MQKYEEAVKLAARYLEYGTATEDELRHDAQAKKDGSYTPRGHGQNEILNNVFYDLEGDDIPSADQFVQDVKDLGAAVKAAEAFWDQKSEEMRQRRARGESPFTVEILQALGLQNKGNRLYTILCTPGSDLRQSQEYHDLTNDYLGPWVSRNLVTIYESGCLDAIHNETIGGGGAGSMADLAKQIEAAGNDGLPQFGP